MADWYSNPNKSLRPVPIVKEEASFMALIEGWAVVGFFSVQMGFSGNNKLVRSS